ncbi:MAG: hypothetical protein AVO35_08590 [Candidatus Aegiribacteria sp. MLS_C]|nr:MAG: hypothetical protein AVO35_08590 [Candidatus Aegiribacteria sp. MLS_C]
MRAGSGGGRLTLLRGCRLFTPKDLGTVDLLLCCGSVAAVESRIPVPSGLDVEAVDLSGMIATPGFVDLHVHLTGGGGEGGFSTRVPEMQLSRMTLAGITTVVGVLGTDDVSRHPETLLAKVLGLRDEGITALMMTGSYQFPPVTLTGSVRKDIALIEPVIGVGEVALSDHRSSQPTFEDFVRLAAEARVGGLLGGKPGLVNVHMGGGPAGMDYLFRMLKETEIPVSQVLPTHVTRSAELFEQALGLVEAGGSIDITASGQRRSGGVDSSRALSDLMSRDLPLERVSISSDAGGSLPVFDSSGVLQGLSVAEPGTLLSEFRRLVREEGFPVTEVLGLFTENPAGRAGLAGSKGRIHPGSHADLLVFDDEWELRRVYAGGRLMALDGTPVVSGTFESTG